MELWMTMHPRNASGSEWDSCGIFSSKETALAACKAPCMGAMRFTLEEDVTESKRFFIVTRECPEGQWTDRTEECGALIAPYKCGRQRGRYDVLDAIQFELNGYFNSGSEMLIDAARALNATIETAKFRMEPL